MPWLRLTSVRLTTLCSIWRQGSLRSPPASVGRWTCYARRTPRPGQEYDEADQALSAGRNNLVRRELSELRREYEGVGMSVIDCSRRIIEVVVRFGLRPVEAPQAPEPITEEDLGVVCYQVVLPV